MSDNEKLDDVLELCNQTLDRVLSMEQTLDRLVARLDAVVPDEDPIP